MALPLNCFVVGDDPERVFTVKIPKTDNVSALKDLIKEKKTRILNHVDASDLDLWAAELKVDALTKDLMDKTVEKGKKLSPTQKFSAIFDNVPNGDCLHIIAKPRCTS